MQPSPFLHRRSIVIFLSAIALFLGLAQTTSAQSGISAASILDATNAQRKAQGIAALQSDRELAAIAQERLNDMFGQQYFAHTNPQGQQVYNLAQDSGYDYIEIGENLALGYYEDTDGLVKAWMDSPGHRANILRKGYTAIGIAVGTGMYQGEESLIAVQVFARPQSACEQPSSDLKASIAAGQTYVQKVSAALSAYVKAGSSIPGIYAIANQVSDLMALFTNDLNQKVAQYNKQVVAYQACARG